MQKIPSLYGFSIITLVLVLMVINHFVYLRILENSLAQVNTPEQNGVAEDLEDNEASSEQTEDSANGATEGSIQDALDESSVNSGDENTEDGDGETDPDSEEADSNGTAEDTVSPAE